MAFEKLDEMIQRDEALAQLCSKNCVVDPELYKKYDVKRGLRDINGKGVLAGLTEISEVCSMKVVDGVETPCEGKLYYRGVDIEDIVRGFRRKAVGLKKPPTCCYLGISPTNSSWIVLRRSWRDTAPFPPPLCGISS